MYVYIYVYIYIYTGVVTTKSSARSCGRFPKFHRVFLGRDPGTLKSDMVSKKTSTINLFGFETLKLKIRILKLWKSTVLQVACPASSRPVTPPALGRALGRASTANDNDNSTTTTTTTATTTATTTNDNADSNNHNDTNDSELSAGFGARQGFYCYR